LKSLKRPINLLLIPTLLTVTGCGDSNVQRDIYNNKEECLSDWGPDDLCEEIILVDTDDGKRTSSSGVGTSFLGPTYNKNNRKVEYKGRLVTPRYSTSARPFISIPHNSPTARSSLGKPVSRGGFGGRSGSSFGG